MSFRLPCSGLGMRPVISAQVLRTRPIVAAQVLRTRPIIGDSGWVPLKMHRQCMVLKYWFRACSLPPNGLVRKVVLWMCKIVDGGKVKWVARTRSLLHACMEGRVDGTLEIRGLRDALLADNFLDSSGKLACGVGRP